MDCQWIVLKPCHRCRSALTGFAPHQAEISGQTWPPSTHTSEHQSSNLLCCKAQSCSSMCSSQLNCQNHLQIVVWELSKLICSFEKSEKHEVKVYIHSFIHSEYLYSASSSPLLLRGASDTSRILCRIFTPKRQRETSSEGLAQGVYYAVRAGFEPATFRTKCNESINEPPCPTNHVLSESDGTNKKFCAMKRYFLNKSSQL